LTQRLFLTAVLVRDYDQAIAFYVDKLGFEVRVDSKLSNAKRWVVLVPAGGGQGCLLLAKASTSEQADYSGNPRLRDVLVLPVGLIHLSAILVVLLRVEPAEASAVFGISQRTFYAAASATRFAASVSRTGGWPNIRPYSRVNCCTLS